MIDVTHMPLATVLVAAAGTFIWRAAGAVLAGRVDPEGLVVRWFGLTAYALLAALVVRLVGLPGGALGETPYAVRGGAVAVTLAVWWLSRRNVPLAVFDGTACFVAGLALLRQS